MSTSSNSPASSSIALLIAAGFALVASPKSRTIMEKGQTLIHINEKGIRVFSRGGDFKTGIELSHEMVPTFCAMN